MKINQKIKNKRLSITRFSAKCIANLKEINFDTTGNVMIKGQNGVGKSTIGRAILWVLNGNINDGEKLISEFGIGMPNVEVELYDGQNYITLTKSIIQRTDNQGRISRTVEHLINGSPAQQKDFQDFFYRQIPATEIFRCMLNLGAFFRLKPELQRQILTKLFCNITDADVIASDETLSDLTNGDVPVEQFGEKMRSLKLKLAKDADAIPKQIEELERQTVDVADEREKLKVQIHALETELTVCKDKIQAIVDSRRGIDAKRKEYGDITSEYWKLNHEISSLRKEIEEKQIELQELRDQYLATKDTCPTCGHTIDTKRTEKIKADITRKGKAFNADLAELEKKLDARNQRYDEVRARMKELEKWLAENVGSSDEEMAHISKRDNLQREISARQTQIARIESQLEINSRNDARIAELRKFEKTLGSQINECERQLALVARFIQRRMDFVTDTINGQFDLVKFKMFEVLKNGTIRNTCEATLNNVPYGGLSKGEKLKAALDILQTFQNYYGVELPLIIDDAESYTQNSLIDIPNQKILLKVAEGQELKIESEVAEIVDERRLTA